MRNELLRAHKDPTCPHCKNASISTHKKESPNMVDMISVDHLNDTDTVIIDVRQPEELIADPVRNDQIKDTPINIPLPELISRLDELPEGKRLALLCAGNIRSKQAAEYLATKGYENVCILDKFSL